MGDAHQVVVNDIGEIVGGQPVPLEQDLVVQGGVLYRNITENRVVEGGAPLIGDLLADDVGCACVQLGLDFLRGERAAGVGGPAPVPGILLALGFLAEAVVGVALLHQQPCVLAVGVPPLRLDIGGHGPAHIGALVMGEAALSHGAVDHVGRTLHQSALVGILNAQDKGAIPAPGDQPGV